MMALKKSVSILFSYNFASFIFKRAKCSFSIISNILLLTFWVIIYTLHLWKWKWANRVQVWFQNLLWLSCHSYICFLITPCLISIWRHVLFNQRTFGLWVRKVGFCFRFNKKVGLSFISYVFSFVYVICILIVNSFPHWIHKGNIMQQEVQDHTLWI